MVLFCCGRFSELSNVETKLAILKDVLFSRSIANWWIRRSNCCSCQNLTPRTENTKITIFSRFPLWRYLFARFPRYPKPILWNKIWRKFDWFMVFRISLARTIPFFLIFTRSNEFYRVGSRWSIKRWMSPSNSLNFQTVRNELFLNYSITITKWQVKHTTEAISVNFTKNRSQGRYSDQNWADICTQN